MKNQARGDETKKLFAKIQESSHLEDDVTQCITCYKIASRNRHYLMLRCTIEEKHTSNREIAVPEDNSQAENWSAEDNLAVIIETAGLNSA
ncbi:hypothetical protein [Nitrosomonas communis]|uniref:Uncharacterized protein n=2 Tax=Nitrosomonas communis TaxID=44574 RepID=A0A0F7KCZ6_9PROT|nr:hypothetical protein [Nitrosomonas communis]AKH37456.1 hypothetical protein AAW31_05905 [Nitrosomonas communis]